MNQYLCGNGAIRLPQYSDMKAFTPPDGVQVLRINRATNLPVDDSCPGDSFSAAFLVGAAPQGTCSRMGEDTQSLGDRLFHPTDQPVDSNGYPLDGSQPADTTKHRNIFQKMFGLGKDKTAQTQQPQ